jgi:hypothetical protein
LEAEFGNRMVREFTADDIRDYLFGLPYGAVTHHILRVVGTAGLAEH